MATLLTAVIVLGFLALIIGLLMFVNNRDRKRDKRNTTLS